MPADGLSEHVGEARGIRASRCPYPATGGGCPGNRAHRQRRRGGRESSATPLGASIPAADPVHDEAAVFLCRFLPGEMTRIECLVRSYKLLAGAERAFRTMKSIDLQVRPVHHRLSDRVRAHIFICMLAHYVRWHLDRAWAPLLFKDEAKPLAADVVAPARRSTSALAKASSHRLPDGSPVHNFRSLLRDLATLTKNTVQVPTTTATFEKLAIPTPLQQRALQLIGLSVTL